MIFYVLLAGAKMRYSFSPLMTHLYAASAAAGNWKKRYLFHLLFQVMPRQDFLAQVIQAVADQIHLSQVALAPEAAVGKVFHDP